MSLSRLLVLPLLGLLLVSCGGAKAQPESPSDAAPTHAPSSLTARGVLEPRQVVYALGGSENDYRKCFMRAVGSRGYVRTRFHISPRGEVESVVIAESTIDRPEINECIAERLKSQLFGSLDEPKQAEWTFVFRLTDPVPERVFRSKLRSARQKREDGISLLKSSSGTLDLDHVAQRVAVNYPLVARCYRASLEREKAPGGILKLKLSIAEDGRVVRVDDAGSVMADAFAVDCAAEGFFAMEFQRPMGGPADLIYRIELE